jgi:hypothetical protein
VVDSGILRTKAELLCYGIAPSKSSIELSNIQNPGNNLRTGNVGLGFRLGGLYVNSPFGHKFTKKSPYKIEQRDDKWFVTNGKEEYEIIPRVPSSWCSEKFGNGKMLSDYVAEEGNNMLVANVYDGCEYFYDDEQCKFCGIQNNKKPRVNDPDVLAGIINIAFLFNPNYKVLLTGGNMNQYHKGAAEYFPTVRTIKVYNPRAVVTCELAPPDDTDILKTLLWWGADNFCCNIEIWDDILRQQVCPGKSKIPKNRYFESWAFGLETIGPNSMETGLVTGLEPVSSVKKGIENITAAGVIPSAIPFHPNDGCVYEDRSPCDPDILIEVSEIIADGLKLYGLNPKEHSSCTSCGACTIESDI